MSSEIKCEKCKHYCRVVNHLGKTLGYVCNMWLDGIAGNSDWYYPSEACFERRDKRIKIDYLKEFSKNSK